MEDLSEIRTRIDGIDDQICKLFCERMACAREVAEYKRAKGMPVLDRGRERKKLAAVAEKVPEDLRSYTQVLFDLLMAVSRAQQGRELDVDSKLERQIRQAELDTVPVFPTTATVACQGVEGAYSQLAADRLFRRPAISYFETFEGVFRAVDEGFCRYGVLPVENSVRLKVDHNLLALPGARIEDIRDIYSHQQAIDQCREFLRTLPNASVHVCENTAMAAKLVAKSGRADVAALSSRACATLYDLEPLARNVQDSDANFTRFACISKDLEIYPGANRTSLMVVTGNEPGSLYKVLARLYALDINIVKLESRPLPKSDFEFMFYFDLDAPAADPEFPSIVGSLGDTCEEYRYLGSYSELV